MRLDCRVIVSNKWLLICDERAVALHAFYIRRTGSCFIWKLLLPLADARSCSEKQTSFSNCRWEKRLYSYRYGEVYFLLGDGFLLKIFRSSPVSALITLGGQTVSWHFPTCKPVRTKGLSETWRAAFLSFLMSQEWNVRLVREWLFAPFLTLAIRGTRFMSNNLKRNYKQIKIRIYRCVLNKQLQLLANCCHVWVLKHFRVCCYWKNKVVTVSSSHHRASDYFFL